jgi:prepilin-type N-terminal cleavage/methylation domain-containing protein
VNITPPCLPLDKGRLGGVNEKGGFKMFKLIHNMKKRDERGFTLVELLIVIAIISILAAIAIPQFAAYRARAVEASMVADAKNFATAQEVVFTECFAYGTLTATTGPARPRITIPAGAVPAGCIADVMPTVSISAGNRVSSTGGATFTVTVINPGGREGRRTHTLNNLGEITWGP